MAAAPTVASERMAIQAENQIGVFTTDRDLVIQVWDAALERMTGIGAESASGKRLTEVFPDLDSRRILSRFERSLAEGTVEVLAPALHRFLIACPPTSPSKHFLEMRQHVRIAPLTSMGASQGLIVTVEDVTGRMEAEIEETARLKDPDETVRIEAAKAIAASEEPLAGGTADPIIEGLGDPSWRVRRNLVDGMARRAAPDAIASLLRAVRDKHLDFGVVNAALQILRASSVDTTDTLVQFLRSEETDLRMHAALALGEQDDRSVVPALMSALDDGDANVRFHVIEALGKLGAVESAERLFEIAQGGDFFLAFPALDALAQIGDPVSSGRLIPLLHDEALREAAMRAVGSAGKPADVEPIVALLNRDGTLAASAARAALSLFTRQYEPAGREAVKAAARRAITEAGKRNLADAIARGDRTALPVLIPFAGWFQDKAICGRLADLLGDAELGAEVENALIEQGDPAGECLVAYVSSETEDVRRSAVRVLGKLGNRTAVPVLAELIESGDRDDAKLAIEAVAAIGGPESKQLLEGLLTGPDLANKETAIRACGTYQGSEFARAIIAASRDPHESVRRAAVEQLPRVLGGGDALVEAFNDESPRVRAAAARAAAESGNPDALPHLRAALRDADPWTRYFSVRGIGAFRDSASAGILEEMIESDPAEQVRVAAREVASELGK